MPSPSSSLATLRPDLAGSLTEFDLAMDRQGFIGLRVLPVMEVMKASGKFGKIPIEQLLQNRETDRAPGGGYSRGQWTFEPASYATDEHGAEEPVDDREAEMYAEYFDAEMVSTQRALDAVLRNQEKRVADLVFNTDTWTGSSLTTAIGTVWSNKSSSTPVDDILGAKLKVYGNSGMWPNAVIMARETFLRCRETDQIRDRIASSGAGDSTLAGRITLQQLAQAFDVDQVIVAGSSKNTANEGVSASLSSIWNKTMVMVCRVAQTNDIREPCVGRVFHWGEDGSSIGGTVESYRDETVRSDVIRVRHDVEEQILYTEMGHLLTAALS